MFQRDKIQHKFKTYKSDAAPFFFFIDIYPLNPTNFESPRSLILTKVIRINPIMPLPMRVDRVFNGESSIIVRPNTPISFPINETITAVINPTSFFQLGIEKLLFFTEIRAQERLYLSLKRERVNSWWEATKYLYGNLHQIEEDFSAFLRAYLYTIVKAKVDEEDITGAAMEYCDIVNNICKERMIRNTILVEIEKNQNSVKLYREKTERYRKKLKTVKDVKYHPELIDIEVYNLLEQDYSNQEDFKDLIKDKIDSNVVKYIPLLFYDDLQECMLQNLKLLETNEMNLLDPSFLAEKNVVILYESEELDNTELNKYSWLGNLRKVNIESIYNSIFESLNQLNEK
jgi:hypothetical protein